jgi:proteic killer suppression protein
MKRNKEKYFPKEYQNGTRVLWGKAVERQLARLPAQISEKFDAWVFAVTIAGIRKVRMRPGLHDEPLKGNWAGSRSVRLSRSYRVIYQERDSEKMQVIEVTEVSKHAY